MLIRHIRIVSKNKKTVKKNKALLNIDITCTFFMHSMGINVVPKNLTKTELSKEAGCKEDPSHNNENFSG